MRQQPIERDTDGLITLSPEEVCRRLNVSNQTLTNWRYHRTGPGWRKVTGSVGQVGGRVRYPEDELNTWLAQRRREGRPVIGRPAGRRPRRERTAA